MATEKGIQETSEHQKKHKKTKKIRKRLHKAIRELMEFYFGDSNLGKDRFLGKLIKESEDGYVDISVFLKFNKLRALTDDINEILKALKKSEILKVSEDSKFVKRITPIKNIQNVDELTVYVENLPREATHDWIKDSFKQFGTINYVSLPKFRSSQKIKGFAFVEFDNKESADSACRYFSSTPYLLGSLEPNEEISKHTGEIGESERNAKRRRDSNDDEEPAKRVKKSLPESNSSTVKQAEKLTESHKKKRKKKKKHKEKNEADTLHLSVIPKLQWIQIKKKYLALQRASMAEVKKCFAVTPDNNRLMAIETSVENDHAEIQISKIPEYVPGVIVKIDVEEPFSNSKQIRSEMKAILGVSYVDIQDERTHGYIRCQMASVTDNVVKAIENRGVITVLQGKEEEEYWKKLFIERETKRETRTKPKQRGSNKIMQRAVKSLEKAKHIRFE